MSQIRQSMPVMNHKRQDIFGAISKGEYVIGGIGDSRKWKFGQVTLSIKNNKRRFA